jgi:asparagine synthase (glutamine-hydrolysing)
MNVSFQDPSVAAGRIRESYLSTPNPQSEIRNPQFPSGLIHSPTMCGIAGIFSRGGEIADAEERLGRALRAMTHRGPDGEGRFIEPKRRVVMGMRRLAIQDPEGGKQPVFTEDGSIAAVFNGEIYNYVELREELRAHGHVMASGSDSEVIVHLYEEKGPDFLDDLNGMFSIALWDARAERFLLARDPMGIKPLFYAAAEDGKGSTVRFASELTALEELLPSRPAVDAVALKQLLTLGYPFCPRTIYQGVRAVQPGECVLVGGTSDGWIDRKLFGQIPNSECSESLDEAADRVDEAFRNAIRRQLRSDVPLGLFLSGGIDSGLVAAYAHAVDPAPRPAFFLGFAERSYDEEPLARATARRCGFEFIRAELKPEEVDWEKALRLYDQPNMDFSIINSFVISRVARERVKTVLGGDGGDEIFGGYQTYQANLWANALAKVLPIELWRALTTGLDGIGASFKRTSWDFFLRAFAQGMTVEDRTARHLAWRRLLRPDETHAILPGLKAVMAADPLEVAAPDYRDCLSRPGAVHPFLAIDQRTYLEGDTLTKTDRGTMAASLEARVPLLDLELVRASRSVSDQHIVTRMKTKVILRRLAERMLPPEVASAPKGGFTAPVQVWMKEGRIGPANALFTPSTLDEVGLVSAPILKWWNDHRAGRANHGRRLWTILQLVDWARRRNLKLGTQN